MESLANALGLKFGADSPLVGTREAPAFRPLPPPPAAGPRCDGQPEAANDAGVHPTPLAPTAARMELVLFAVTLAAVGCLSFWAFGALGV